MHIPSKLHTPVMPPPLPLKLALCASDSPQSMSIEAAFAARPDEVHQFALHAVRDLCRLSDLRIDIKLLELYVIFQHAMAVPSWNPPTLIMRVLQACRSGQLEDELEGRYYRAAGPAGVIGLYLATKDDKNVFKKIESLTEENMDVHCEDVKRISGQSFTINYWVDNVFDKLSRTTLPFRRDVSYW